MTLTSDHTNVACRFSFHAIVKTFAVATAALLCSAAHAGVAQDGPAMDGGYEPVSSDIAADTPADAQFHALFMSWKHNDSVNELGAPTADAPMTGAISIPSMRPVTLASINFTSGFGVRSDPFRGSSAMHAGIDLAGPIGTPIYATADGIVGRAGWTGGYGNLVQIEHGRGIETRYGHLSRILVAPNSRVHRGQLIALMGSTGRSTGSHLHYEIRIDGRAVNPVPYLQSAQYAAAYDKPDGSVQATQLAMGGPIG